MYIPKFKQTLAKYTDGAEFDIESTGETYRGFYVKTSKGEYFTGRGYLRGTSQKLIEKNISNQNYLTPVPEEYDNIKQDRESLQLKKTLQVPSYIPTKRYQDTSIYRYFAKSKVTGSILEISNETYNELLSKNVKYHYPSYDILQLEWFVSSPAEDIVRNGYILEGSINKNKRQIVLAERTLPGISEYLTDPTELIL